MYEKGGGDFGFQKITDCICIPIVTCREVLSTIKVYVPIQDYAEYYYPAILGQALETAKKTISFTPPGELLQGERIHQFIGARTRTNSADYKNLPDLERIARQQIFMQALVKDKFDFSIFLNYSIIIQASQLARFKTVIQTNYQYCLFNPGLKMTRIDNKLILLPSYHRNLPTKIHYLFLLYFKRILIRLKSWLKK